MKKELSLLGLCLLLLSMLAYAKTVNMKVNIPFSFVAGKTTLPPGEYTIEGLGSAGNAIAIRKLVDNSAVGLVLAHRCESRDPQNASKLVFHRYAGRYFLAQIWMAGDNSGQELPKSRREVETALDYPSQDVVLFASLR